MGTVAEDTGLDQDASEWGRITKAYQANMDALRNATLAAGKFAWQLMWTGGSENQKASTGPHAIVSPSPHRTTWDPMCMRRRRLPTVGPHVSQSSRSPHSSARR